MNRRCSMFNGIRMAMLFSLSVLLAGGCASLPAQDKNTETLKPAGVHEDCMELLPGETLDYSFEASSPLDFNVHYHEDHGVFYVVSKDASRADKGTYLCEKQQYYCLMWTNPGAETATLLYERIVIKKQK
jgi:hypothetical protein